MELLQTKIKKIINKMKRQPTKWEKILANDMSHKRLMPQIHKKSRSPALQADSLPSEPPKKSKPHFTHL